VRRYKLYLAGPEVFLPKALEHAEKQRVICRKFDFIPLHPMDNSLDLGNRDIKTAMRIYLGDIGQIRESNILVANCNGFRGVCMDDGSAYELGYGNALGKISYGYIRELTSLVARVRLSRFLIPSKEDAMAGAHPHARIPARSQTESAHVHQPGDPALGTSPSH